ncbi:MAG: transferase [Candidatus Magnetoglobus multicellularis str. Araruama]|uniref:Transferase n=1 Tax=Candidatus Magnetoglobus multicellularis str. Araruama TaxID=890399 RepID=A0A1V1P4N1_9BACT|nr:MAG: transferase [Candidatus Magnetoglobus multicellularis str. Araruama]
MKKIYIVGAGGHTRSLFTVLENKYEIDGIYDDTYDENNQETINGYKLVGKIDAITNDIVLVISSGDCDKRLFLYNRFKPQLLLSNLIHSTSIIEKWTSLGQSNQIFASSCLNSNVKIGNNNIINTGAIIEHETCIGNHNHISVNSVLCGRVYVGDQCFIGAGAIVIDNISICDNVTVGAGSVVIRNIDFPGTYVGSPAIKIK